MAAVKALASIVEIDSLDSGEHFIRISYSETFDENSMIIATVDSFPGEWVALAKKNDEIACAVTAQLCRKNLERGVARDFLHSIESGGDLNEFVINVIQSGLVLCFLDYLNTVSDSKDYDAVRAAVARATNTEPKNIVRNVFRIAGIPETVADKIEVGGRWFAAADAKEILEGDANGLQ